MSVNHTPDFQEATVRDTDIQHWTLQEHIRKCDQCRKELDTRKAKGLGQKSNMCPEYQRIIQTFSEGWEL